MRTYCWRVGAVLELAEAERCPECGAAPGSPEHPEYAAQCCGSFVRNQHCALEPGHGGLHVEAEAVVSRVIES
jgi:hypothetical protein